MIKDGKGRGARLALAMLLFCAMLTGCGGAKDEESVDAGTIMNSFPVTTSEEKIVIKAESDDVVYVAEPANLQVPEDAGYLRSVAPNGKVWGVDPNGEIWGTAQLSGTWDFSNVREVLIDQDCVYLSNAMREGELEVRSCKGELLGTVNGKGGMLNSVGGGLYVLRQTGEMGSRLSISKVDAQKRELGEELTRLPDNVRGIFQQGSDEENLYFYTADVAYRYSYPDKVFYEIFAWADVGVLGTSVSRAWKDASGDYYVESMEEGRKDYVRILPQNREEVPQKKELTVAILTGDSDGNLQQFVTEYNKLQEEYHVTIKKFANLSAGDSLEDAKVRMAASLLGSDPPDLICLANLSNAEDWAEQGYLMDLRRFLSKSEVIGEEDFYPEILAYGSCNGLLYKIPYEFSMETLVVPASEWKDQPGWTYDQMIRYCRDRGEYRPFRQALYLKVFLFRDPLDYFWDAEKKEAHFDSAEFSELLKYVKECQENEAKISLDEKPFYVERLDYGRLASYPDFKEEHGEIVVMGYPQKDARPRTVITGTTELSIPTSARDAEGAWNFLEFCLSRDPLEDGTNNYKLYSNRNYLERLIEKELSLFGKDHEDVLDENGNVVRTIWSKHNVDQESVDAFREMLANARKAPVGNGFVRTIVLEESEAWFSGQKNPDRVIDVSQNSVRLYLSE